MAPGDNNLDQCPVCKAQFHHVGMQILDQGKELWFQVTCSKCGFVGPADLKREEAISKWNSYLRKDRTLTR